MGEIYRRMHYASFSILTATLQNKFLMIKNLIYLSLGKGECCVESLCCGTPVFGFKAGAPEMISLPEYSFFFDQGDTEALAQALQEYCSSEPFHAMSICELARKQYAKDVMFENYFELYQKTAQLL